MSGLMTGNWQRPGPPGRASPIPVSLMIVLENALSWAWQVLLDQDASGKFALCSAKEDEITEQIQVILGELHAAEPTPVAGFSEFSLGSRDAKVRNFDGRRLDLQPDLTFYPLRGSIPTTNTLYAGIFVECKPVDSKHPVGTAYCREGLARFIRGDYAWAVDRALMVGYVRNRCGLPGGILICTKGAARQAYGFRGGIEEVSTTCHGDKVFRSIHRRSFQLDGRPVGSIALDHLWLYPSSPYEATRCQGTGASA